jgi:flagellar biosynthesis anti-sigma factor FlgM
MGLDDQISVGYSGWEVGISPLAMRVLASLRGFVMDIKKIVSYSTQPVQKTKEAKGRTGGFEKNTTVLDAGSTDQVKLSRSYKEVSNIKRVMAESADVRKDRVEEVRIRIENNTYKVEPGKIAERMLMEAW